MLEYKRSKTFPKFLLCQVRICSKQTEMEKTSVQRIIFSGLLFFLCLHLIYIFIAMPSYGHAKALVSAMECIRLCIASVLLYISLLVVPFTLTDARRYPEHFNNLLQGYRLPVLTKKLEEGASNIDPYGVLSPISLPPFQCIPPFCTSTESPRPSTSGSIQSPLLPPASPPNHHLIPPPTYQPSPTPPHKNPKFAVWCVAKPTVPDSLIKAAMDYACGFGGDCGSIQPNGSCYQPNTLLSHASYAFNSYWQNTKLGGGTCDFGGTAMLVTADPGTAGCDFISK